MKEVGPQLAGFAPIVTDLRVSVEAQLLSDPESPGPGPSVAATVDTNSTWIERRGLPLVRMLEEAPGSRPVRGSSLVDLGCGFGALSLLFAHLGAEVIGVDLNAPRLEVAERLAGAHGLAASFRYGRFEENDLPSASFDFVVANNSLCYVRGAETRRTALAECFRVLRPGGWLVVRNPNRGHPIDQFTRLPLIHILPPDRAYALARRVGRRRSPVRLVTVGKAARELRATGFESVSVLSSTGRPAGLRARVARYQHLRARRPLPQ